jgi:hypothetical protein
LRPNKPSPVKPLAVWTFEDGTARDEMGYFGEGQIYGGATIQDGKLILDGKAAYMTTPPK